MTNVHDDDPWLGALHRFPTVLHARASFSFDINPESLQKALLSALSSLRSTSLPKEITVADRDGYAKGRVDFKIGIGNGRGFDILDAREEERIFNRIENRRPFNTIDMAFHLHYAIDDDLKHKVHEDHYVMRLVFQPGRVEVLVHHLKGMRRVEPSELVRLVLGALNTELSREELSEVDLKAINSS
jgi:hypothetical protein